MTDSETKIFHGIIFLIVGSIVMLPFSSIAIKDYLYVKNLPVGTCFAQQGNAIDNFGDLHSSVIIENVPLIPSITDILNGVSNNITTKIIYPPPPGFILKKKSEVESFKAGVTSTETVSCHYDLKKGVAYQSAIGIIGWGFGFAFSLIILVMFFGWICYVLRRMCIDSIKSRRQSKQSTVLNRVTTQ